jgi:hypothetical protein
MRYLASKGGKGFFDKGYGVLCTLQGAGHMCPRPWDIKLGRVWDNGHGIFPGKRQKYSISDATHGAFFKEGYGAFLKAAP